MRRADRDEAGFTLLEIIVALVVLGILLATLSRGVQFGLAAFDRQDRMVTVGGRLEAVDRTLRRLLETLDPGTSNDGDTLVGGPHAMAWRAPLAEPSHDPKATADDGTGEALANLRLSVIGHDLVLSRLPFRHVIPVGVEAATPQRTVLLGGVAGIDLSYWGAGGWHTDWRNPAPPDLVRVRIRFPDGDQRRWPDIVVAPVRMQAGN
jgi:general secretion pathway protein J